MRKITKLAVLKNSAQALREAQPDRPLNMEGAIDTLAEAGIVNVPYFPLGGFNPMQTEEPGQVASELALSPQSVALASLLHRSRNILPIPGTSRRAHLHENTAAARVRSI